MKKLLTILIICISIIGIFYFLFLSSLCSIQTSSKMFSPDGRYMVQIQEARCGGATGDTTTDVRLTNANNSNILSAWIDNGKNIFSIKANLPSVQTSWVDNHIVKITYVDCKTIYRKDVKWNDVEIRYDEKCSAE